MKRNQLKTGIVLSYITILLGLLISLTYTPIMIRLLGQSEYGLFNLANSTIGYLGILEFGFSSSYIRFYSRYKAENDTKHIENLNGLFICVYSTIAILTIILGTVLVHSINGIFKISLSKNEILTVKILMSLLLLNLVFSLFSSVFSSYIMANEQFIFQKTLLLLKTIINPLIVLPVLLLGFKSIGLVLVTVFLGCAVNVINIIFCLKNLDMKFSFQNLDKALLYEITVFSSFIFINMIVDQINWNVDTFLLGILKGTSSVAVYSVAGQITLYYKTLSTSITSVFTPRIHYLATANNDHELTVLFVKIGRIQFLLLAMVFIGFSFWGKPFLVFWAGGEYIEAYYILIILLISLTVPLIQNTGIEIQKAKNKHRFRSLLYLFIAVLNVCISIPLCRILGGVGCAVGTAISLILGNGIIINIYYYKKIGIDIILFWKQILGIIPILIIPTVYGYLVQRLCNLYNIFIFLISGMGFVIIYTATAWFLGMNGYEKNLIRRPFTTIIAKLKEGKLLK